MSAIVIDLACIRAVRRSARWRGLPPNLYMRCAMSAMRQGASPMLAYAVAAASIKLALQDAGGQ